MVEKFCDILFTLAPAFLLHDSFGLEQMAAQFPVPRLQPERAEKISFANYRTQLL